MRLRRQINACIYFRARLQIVKTTICSQTEPGNGRFERE